MIRYDNAGTVPTTGTTPGIELLREFGMTTYGFANLGTWGVRNIKGGSTLSLHAVGGAWDAGWHAMTTEGGGAKTIEEAHAVAVEASDFLVAHAEDIGIQLIIDYWADAARIWKCDRTGDDKDEVWLPKAWFEQRGLSVPVGFGTAWGRWLHIELNLAGRYDTRPILERIAGVPDQPPPPVIVPPPIVQEDPAMIPIPPTVKLGDHNNTVRRAQGLLLAFGAYLPDIGKIDGIFGPKTDAAVRALQKIRGLTQDGIIGRNTWRELFEDT